MTEVNVEQVRDFRLRAHHLDRAYGMEEVTAAAGACGMQNTPPGAWETALHNRIASCTLQDMQAFLYRDKSLLQAWSLRGAPVVFPAREREAFLTALIPEEGEPWIYTRGITLALDFLGMTFEETLGLLLAVIPRLGVTSIAGKNALDQTLAEWIAPLLPAKKRQLWDQPSMYGSPDRQTVGGAAVSFLLRPCSFLGAVVFGGQAGGGPAFTSLDNWIGTGPGAASGQEMDKSTREKASAQLVRKYLHCYGPSTTAAFGEWLGCSGGQARRIWHAVQGELEPVKVLGKTAWLLSSDRGRLFLPDRPDRELLLLGGHDPFLDQRDRAVLQPDKSLQRLIWRTVANPGAVVYRGEVIGIWNSRKKGTGMEVSVALWNHQKKQRALGGLAEEYAAFRGLRLTRLEFTE